MKETYLVTVLSEIVWFLPTSITSGKLYENLKKKVKFLLDGIVMRL